MLCAYSSGTLKARPEWITITPTTTEDATLKLSVVPDSAKLDYTFVSPSNPANATGVYIACATVFRTSSY